MSANRIFLIGLSGSGKSAAARLIASELGWDAADSDRVVEALAGKPVADIFAAEGEAGFRDREAAVLAQLSRRANVVIATGGGAPTTPGGRRAISRGFVAWLRVSPGQASARLAAQSDGEVRPLLLGDTQSRLAAQLEARAPTYALADATIDCDGLSPAEAAAEVIRRWREAGRSGSGRFATALPAEPDVAAMVETAPAGATYPVIVRDGALASLGETCRNLGLRGRAFIITDEAVAPLHAASAGSALASAGFTTSVTAIPTGEENKTLATLDSVYAHLLDARVERSDFAVCLGGGVVTDLGGFAAATVLRGIDFVHVPTTLLGMLDAAVGGKVAVDHPRGKNMIGVFAQPRAVVIDPAVLATLPVRQVRAGLAELIKHAFILDEGLVCDLESAVAAGANLATAEIIARSVAIKAAIVSEDEREGGRRTLLNYGHTLGHALEAVTGFGTHLHGEAVAIGMHAAGLIAVELGILEPAAFARQQALIRGCGLPERAPGVDAGAVLEAARSDKKVQAGAIRWVLLDRIGHAAIRHDVPPGVARRAAEAVLS